MFFISYEDRFFHLGYLNVLYICSLINKLYARRKYQSNVQIYVTANYEINKNANFFFPFIPDGELGTERLLVHGEKKIADGFISLYFSLVN